MGNSESVKQLKDGFGYRIIQISPGSPGEQVGLQLFMDFIIDIDLSNQENKKQENQNQTFFEIVNQNENKDIQLTVYNMKTRLTRPVTIIPNKNWENSDSLLGIMLRHENYENAHELTYRVLSVQENSPAQKCGLVALQDYIIGLVKFKYSEINEMIDHIVGSEFTKEKGLEIIVYNAKDDQIRLLFVKPNFKWGGRGSLGCQFGSGFLNQIPTDYQKFQQSLDTNSTTQHNQGQQLQQEQQNNTQQAQILQENSSQQHQQSQINETINQLISTQTQSNYEIQHIKQLKQKKLNEKDHKFIDNNLKSPFSNTEILQNLQEQQQPQQQNGVESNITHQNNQKNLINNGKYKNSNQKINNTDQKNSQNENYEDDKSILENVYNDLEQDQQQNIDNNFVENILQQSQIKNNQNNNNNTDFDEKYYKFFSDKINSDYLIYESQLFDLKAKIESQLTLMKI